MLRGFALFVVVVFCGCGDKSPTSSSPTSQAPPSPPASVAPPPPAEPAFKLTAAELAALAVKDDSGDKYKSKVMEVTGAFEHLGIGSYELSLVLRGVPDPKRPGYNKDVVASFKTDEFAALEKLKLSIGQSVTILGTSKSSAFNNLEDCKIVKTGPSTATGTTMADVEKALVAQKHTKDMIESAGVAPYVGKDVLIRVKLKEKFNDWQVVSPEGSKRRFFIARPFMNNTYGKKFDALKAGDEVLVMAMVYGFSDGMITFSEARVLDTPPDGVKMP